jgi:hypothetical protein
MDTILTIIGIVVVISIVGTIINVLLNKKNSGV